MQRRTTCFVVAALIAGLSGVARADPKVNRPGERPGGTWRALFWASVAVTATTAVEATIAGQSLGPIHDDANRAVRSWQEANPDKAADLSGPDACGAAGRLADGGDALAGQIVNICGRGRSRAMVTNVLMGASVAAAIGAAFFYYEGYVAAPREDAARVTIAPSLSPTGAGAVVRVTF
jgi:hypothetical protein